MSVFVSVPKEAAGSPLADWLSRAGHFLSAPCGGRGVCGKCRVTVVSGRFLDADGAPLLPDRDGTVLACRAVCAPSGAGILLSGNAVSVVAGTAKESPRDVFVLDIGTTTLIAARQNPAQGAGRSGIVRTASCLNPGQCYGADVISRIAACRNGHLGDLQASLLAAVTDLFHALFPQGGNVPATVAGNATMLHLFLGVSPVGMGQSPFLPAFTDARRLSGAELGVPLGEITLLPSVSAFVGGDVTAGMLVLDMDRPHPEPRLLLDLGTNGEMVLETPEGGLFCASTAVGPAFEGGNLSCGMGGVSGAVSSVSVRVPGEPLCFSTIANAPAAGLCGSGLLDLAACLLDLGELDSDGGMEGDYTLFGIHQTPDGGTPVSTSVRLTQKDVRELQLAKSAVRAGTEALLAAAGLTPETFDRAGGTVSLAGGFGHALSPRSAKRIGLLPAAFRRVTAPGNTALAGAAIAACEENGLSRASFLSSRCRTVDLNASPVFTDGFIRHMAFPEA